MRGRPAVLPVSGYQTLARLLLEEGRCTVRVTTEDGRLSKDFDFAGMPIARDLQITFAAAFDRRTGPSGTCKSISSAAGYYYGLRTFADYLSGLPSPPRRPAQLRPAHLEGYRIKYAGQRSLAQRVNGIKRALRAMDGVDDVFAAALRGGGITRDRAPTVLSYTPKSSGRSCPWPAVRPGSPRPASASTGSSSTGGGSGTSTGTATAGSWGG